jgi:hypothetical protein
MKYLKKYEAVYISYYGPGYTKPTPISKEDEEVINDIVLTLEDEGFIITVKSLSNHGSITVYTLKTNNIELEIFKSDKDEYHFDEIRNEVLRIIKYFDERFINISIIKQVIFKEKLYISPTTYSDYVESTHIVFKNK